MDWLTAIRSAFDAMKSTGPSRLLPRVAFEAENHNLIGSGADIIREALSKKDSHIREELHNRLAEWDYDGKAAWTSTERNTKERREEIYKRLALPEELARAIHESLPPKTTDVERDMVITEHAAENWYTAEFRRDREFYWPAFRGYLKEKKRWSEETLNGLSESANRIVENLAPPHSEKPMPRRGLVVGYVQSGKTTNFTAVAAKAIDAGYRLIIILAGTLDILRRQTQRRLDMELVGLENLNILDSEDSDPEYANDEDYPEKFLSLGQIPREVGRPNIKRLTTSEGDFRSIAHSFQALAFDELGGVEKAYTLDSIKKTNVRFFVIKKTVARLKELVRELKHNKKVCEHLPALIVDDESDQASVNTVNPADENRSATNAQIVEMLRLLPRSQYVGYTATPFANVLVDPNSEEDIFPRDFIVSLPRPAGYMGVADFNDMNAGEGDPTPNKDAHVRQFEADDDESLDRAMDAFVVSGAIKLFRAQRGDKGDFRHHTMMIHEQVQNTEQAERKREVLARWKAAGYGSPGPGPARLRDALEKEFRPTWQRLSRELQFPTNYDELKPFVGEALKRMGTTDPIIVVNGARDGVDPEFDKQEHVWKIIIGGAKLSRGFTVEGLTTTYFGRRAAQQDTLMQMGRWFGYRGGYRDLVRLFLQKADGKKFDLYEAFEALCRDEEAFRSQLGRYLRPATGGRPIRPIEVPAVVFNSYPRLAPTARNKMFSATMVEDFVSDGWRFPVDVSLAPEHIESNWMLLERTARSRLKPLVLDGKTFMEVELTRAELSKFMDELRWKGGEERLVAERRFFRSNPVATDHWTLLLPQLQAREAAVGGESVSVHRRALLDDETFKAFTDPTDVKVVAGACRSDTGPLSGRGALLVYPTLVKDDEARTAKPIVGVAVYHPPIPRDAQVAKFTVRGSSAIVTKRP